MGESLEPFSFKKKPIEYLPIHSTISDILPSNEKIKASKSDTDTTKLNNTNYDEQIRAPRINFKNYTIGESQKFESNDTQSDDVVKSPREANDICVKDPFGDMVKALVKEPINYDKPKEASTKEAKKNYTPANFDLNHNNYTYSSSEINLSNDKLDAIKNLNNNLTTEERMSNPYNLKKPLSIPAVLRPNSNDASPESNNSPNSLSSTLSLSLLGDTTSGSNNYLRRSASVSAMSSISDIESYEPTEPTHDHWKPNNFTNSCMKCFLNFSIFNNRRRHHCRFCGFIICSNCLFNSGANPNSNENELIYLDKDSRLVIPIFKNLNAVSLSNYFKLCKICKNCGNNYLNLLFQLNQTNLSTELPIIFIENPFINKSFSLTTTEERKNSFVNTNDWNWSSF